MGSFCLTLHCSITWGGGGHTHAEHLWAVRLGKDVRVGPHANDPDQPLAEPEQGQVGAERARHFGIYQQVLYAAGTVPDRQAIPRLPPA